MNKFKNVKLTNNSVDLEIPNDWTVKKKDSGQSVIYFPFGNYPSLDVNLEFMDNPKIKSEEDIFNFLSEGSKDIRKANRISKNNYSINYRVVTKEENLELWKVLNFNKPRGFRVLRLSLGWIRNQEADEIITSIIFCVLWFRSVFIHKRELFVANPERAILVRNNYTYY